jgi:hypothetical protein
MQLNSSAREEAPEIERLALNLVIALPPVRDVWWWTRAFASRQKSITDRRLTVN